MIAMSNKTKKSLPRRIWQQRAFYLMLLPGVIYFLVYKYFPIILGVMVSVVNYNIKNGLFASKIVTPWYKNFQFFFNSPYFSQLIGNTLIISFAKILIGLPVAVGLAILLYECRSVKFRRIVQTVTYMPHFLSWVVVYGICFALLSESNGIISELIYTFTGTRVKFFSSQPIFRWLVILSDIWKTSGWSAIIYLAAISGIDPCLYEAAHIDGAGRLRSIWSITLPAILPIITINLILRCGSILDAGFDQIFIMYNAAVRPAVDIIDTWVYRTGFENLNLSLSSAVGLFKSVVSMALIITVNKVAGIWGESMW